MFCCPLSQSVTDLLYIHMHHTLFFQRSCDSPSVLLLQVQSSAYPLAPLSDTNEIILCKYVVSFRPENWISWDCVVPHLIMIWWRVDCSQICWSWCRTACIICFHFSPVSPDSSDGEWHSPFPYSEFVLWCFFFLIPCGVDYLFSYLSYSYTSYCQVKLTIIFKQKTVTEKVFKLDLYEPLPTTSENKTALGYM